MEKLIITQLIYLMRIVLAGVCGICVGTERQNRMKVAGVRTHFVIAMAAALMMIVSKYGFGDALTSAHTSVDVSRVAAGILAGVGVMGGGLVITGKGGFTSGITTAAGIWATVGIGMAFGAGMYIIGACATVVLLIGQFVMHKNIRIARHVWRGQIDFQITDKQVDVTSIISDLQQRKIDVLRIKYDVKDGDNEKIKVFFAVTTKGSREEVAELLSGLPHVCSYEF